MTSTTVDTVNPKVKEIFKFFKNPNNTFSYDCLIDRVSKHPTLENWITQKVTNNPKIINLITNNWYSVLENNPTFQEYMNGKVNFFKYDSKANKNLVNYRVQSYTNNLSVMVVGTFKIIEDEHNNNFRVKLIDCVPLECIAEIMCMKLDRKVLPNAKFFIKTCNNCCIKCRKNEVSRDNIWCIQRTMVYDDEKLHYAERKYCTSLYANETKAIIHLEINAAYTFPEGCKIGGSVDSIVFIENIFDVDNKEIQGFLKTDENCLPHQDIENNNMPGSLKLDESYMPYQEIGIKRITENETDNRLKNENVPQEHGIKRKIEDEYENKKYLKSTAEDDIFAIPKGTHYTKPKEKHYDVQVITENMPDI